MTIMLRETAVESIIEEIENSYADIVQLYRSVPVSAVIKTGLPNGWSVKDVLAHIAAWEWRCASLLNASHDTNALLQAEPDVDALNDEAYRERKEWSWVKVEYDFRAAHQAVLTAIRHLPPERLNEGFIRESIAEETWQHYAQHLSDLQHWHKQATHSR